VYKSRSSSLCRFLHPPLTSSFFHLFLSPIYGRQRDKCIPVIGHELRKFVRRRGCQFFDTIGLQMVICTSYGTHYVSATEISWLMLCKIWDFHGGHNEECRLLGYKNPVRTSQGTHYVCATEFIWLILCKIWGFHGGHNEEFRLLVHKNPVLTSQGTHYVSATESSRLILCRIWDFHCSDYE
jgi:hypothetical protein